MVKRGYTDYVDSRWKLLWGFQLIELHCQKIVFANTFITDEFKNRLQKPLQLAESKPWYSLPNVNIGRDNDSANILRDTNKDIKHHIICAVLKFIELPNNYDLILVRDKNNYFVYKR